MSGASFAGLRNGEEQYEKKVLVGTLVAWISGFGAYNLMLWLLYRQRLVGGDFGAVLFWSLVGFGIAVPVVYLPLMRLTAKVLKGRRRALPMAAVAAMAGILPTAAVVYLHAFDLSGLISPEAMLFYVCFAAAGICFGIFYSSGNE